LLEKLYLKKKIWITYGTTKNIQNNVIFLVIFCLCCDFLNVRIRHLVFFFKGHPVNPIDVDRNMHTEMRDVIAQLIIWLIA